MKSCAINSHAIEYGKRARVGEAKVGANESEVHNGEAKVGATASEVRSEVRGGGKAAKVKASPAARLPAELVCMIAAHLRDSERLDMREVCRTWAAALPVMECYRDLSPQTRLDYFEDAPDPNRGVEALITPQFAAAHASGFLHAYVRTRENRTVWRTLTDETIRWLGLARLPARKRVKLLCNVSRHNAHTVCSCSGPCVVMCEVGRVLGVTAADFPAHPKLTQRTLEYAAYEGAVGVMRALLHMGVGAEYARMADGGVVAEACQVGSLKALKCLVREFRLTAHDLLTLGTGVKDTIHNGAVGWTLDYTFRFNQHKMLKFLVREVGITREQVRAAAQALRSQLGYHPWDYERYL